MFDEGAGTRADDATGDYRPATLTGGAGWTASPFGTALQLDGIGSAATDAPAVRTDNAFTVSAWVYAGPGSLGQSSRTAVSQDGDRRSGFRLGYEGAHGWAFEVPRGPADRAGAARAVAPEPPIPEEWTHLAGVFDPAGGQLLLYVNGVASATAQLDTGWVPWHAAGPLQIGRAKVAGLPAGYWSGAVDDVRVFAGVRAQDEIEQDVVNPSGPPVTPYTGSFGRFVNHDGDHMTTTGPPPRGYRFERPLGMPAPDGAAGTRMLYACKLAADMFTSAQADCEGNPKVAAIGRVYASPPADVLTRALYRCKVTSNGEHFESHLDTCEGQSTEGLLGYVRAYAPLVSHLQTDPPNDRRTSIGLVPASYWAERSFGYVALAGGSGERMLYGCQDGDDAFSSRDSACEGKQVLGGNGYVWTAPPPDQDSAGLYRCRAAATGRRYDSLLESCGGDTVDTLLGYVVTAP